MEWNSGRIFRSLSVFFSSSHFYQLQKIVLHNGAEKLYTKNACHPIGAYLWLMGWKENEMHGRRCLLFCEKIEGGFAYIVANYQMK